jgi:hypothetical protein
MPCSRVSSDSVALGLVPALQSNSGVWGRLAQSGEIWHRWYLDWYLTEMVRRSAESVPAQIPLESTASYVQQ